jgi:hypothetical protein
VFLSDASITARVSAAAKRGELVKIGSRLYTSLVQERPEWVVRLHRWEIIRLLFPGLVVGYRTALHAKPTPEGKMSWSCRIRRRRSCPARRSVSWRVLAASGGSASRGWGVSRLPTAGAAGVHEWPRGGGGVADDVAIQVEEFVERRIRTLGERWASEVRDRARKIAPALGLEAQAEELRVMISVQMSTTRSAQSSTELAIRTASCRCAASTASPANGYRVNTA